MKRWLWIGLGLVLSFVLPAFCLVGCVCFFKDIIGENLGGNATIEYIDGGEVLQTKDVSRGFGPYYIDKIDFYKEGYHVSRWVDENGEELTYSFDINTIVKVYAVWEPMFEYELSSDETYYTVTSSNLRYGYGKEKQDIDKVLIFDEYNGLPVKGIENNALKDFSKETVKLSKNLTYIGDEAFLESDIEYITIPLSCINIGNKAFSECNKLKNIIFESDSNSNDEKLIIGTYCFYGCSLLEAILLPNTLETIKEGTFSESGIKYIEFPESIKEIESKAFENCYYLKNVKFNNSIEIIKNNAFKNASIRKVEIFGNTNIENNAFYNCNFLYYVSLGDNVKINNSSFHGGNPRDIYCANEETLEVLKQNYSTECEFHTSLDEKPSTFSIDDFIFSKDFELICYDGNEASITLPREVVYNDETITNYNIRDYALSNNNLLVNVIIPENILKLPKYLFKNCIKLEKVEILGAVEETSTGLFYGCKSLSDVVLPKELKIVSNGTFYECSSLKDIEFENITSIERKAFYGCTNLSKISIPDSLSNICFDAFENCKSLQYNLKNDADYLGNDKNPYLIFWKIHYSKSKVICVDENCKVICNVDNTDTRFLFGDNIMGIGNVKTIFYKGTKEGIRESLINNCSDIWYYSLNPKDEEVGQYWYYDGDYLALVIRDKNGGCIVKDRIKFR